MQNSNQYMVENITGSFEKQMRKGIITVRYISNGITNAISQLLKIHRGKG